MQFGLSLLYGLFGNLNLQSLKIAILGSPMLDGEAGRWAALLAVIFVLTGIGFKIAAVPFHHWCPDAYEGAPTPFTALLSVAPKIAGFALLLRLFYGMFLFPRSYDHFLPESGQIPWVLVLMVLSALTMTLGNLAAILQNNLKRLLAYSSIAHAGYLLMGVVAGGTEGFSSVTLYAGVYVLMNLGAFSVVVAVEGATGSEDLKDWKGLGRKAPLLALCMAVFLFSLVGLPPTAGFVGKLYLFAALLKHGGDWFVVLAVVGIVNSVVSLYYYARVLKAMYLEAPGQVESGAAGRSLAAGVAFALAVPVLILGVFWQPLALVAEWSARFLH
jgi:NADH-quinone oxidoreductase subunit N